MASCSSDTESGIWVHQAGTYVEDAAVRFPLVGLRNSRKPADWACTAEEELDREQRRRVGRAVQGTEEEPARRSHSTAQHRDSGDGGHWRI